MTWRLAEERHVALMTMHEVAKHMERLVRAVKEAEVEAHRMREECHALEGLRQLQCAALQTDVRNERQQRAADKGQHEQETRRMVEALETLKTHLIEAKLHIKHESLLRDTAAVSARLRSPVTDAVASSQLETGQVA